MPHRIELLKLIMGNDVKWEYLSEEGEYCFDLENYRVNIFYGESNLICFANSGFSNTNRKMTFTSRINQIAFIVASPIPIPLLKAIFLLGIREDETLSFRIEDNVTAHQRLEWKKEFENAKASRPVEETPRI